MYDIRVHCFFFSFFLVFEGAESRPMATSHFPPPSRPSTINFDHNWRCDLDLSYIVHRVKKHNNAYTCSKVFCQFCKRPFCFFCGALAWEDAQDCVMTAATRKHGLRGAAYQPRVSLRSLMVLSPRSLRPVSTLCPLTRSMMLCRRPMTLLPVPLRNKCPLSCSLVCSATPRQPSHDRCHAAS